MKVLNSDITIGKFRFSGVNRVHVKRSLHSYVDVASITIPSICKIVKGKSKVPAVLTTGDQFSDGDPVVIKLGYNGLLREEFKGFVKRRDLAMPLVVECEGYSYQLRRNTVNGAWKKISVEDLLAQAVKGTDVKVICTTDITLQNIAVTGGTGADVIDHILKATDGCITAFFISADTLWVGLAYTPYSDGTEAFKAPQVNYRLGWNVVKDNALKERVIEDDPVKVVYNKKTHKGEHLEGFYSRTAEFSRTHRKLLNHIADAAYMRSLSKEKALKLNYTGYEGNISAFLQPFAWPGYKAQIVDTRYPERDGFYLIEGTEVTFGMNGARRVCEIGPKIGFAL